MNADGPPGDEITAPAAEEIRRGSQPDTLLDGENPNSTHPEDAVHWLRVYGELLTLKTELLQRAEEVLSGATDDAIKEAQLDTRLLRAEAERFRRRRAFWTERARELGEPR
ncbi:MAG TPA: hypothetical protein VGQ42_16095 [Candidatus Dormibacteraeota bacterium]|nr:hypothetical protein [Candidatus Dormibacteraeota bacterium]